MNRMIKPTILSISLLTVMAGAAVSPALGAIGKTFADASPATIKMIISLPSLFIIIFSLVSGKLALIYSKRKILLAGLLIYLIGGVGAGFTSTIHQLLILRAILGIGVGLMMPLSVSIIADFYDGEEKARLIALSPAVSALGAIIATPLSGQLASIHWHYSFGIYGLGLFSMILIFLVLPEVMSPPKRPDMNPAESRLPWGVYLQAFFQFLIMLVFFSVPTGLALFIEAERMGGAIWVGLSLAIMNIPVFLAGLIFSGLMKMLKDYAVCFALIFMTLAFWLLSQATSIWMVFMAVAVLGVGYGTLQPIIFLKTTELVSPRMSAPAMSIISGALYLGQFMSPLVMGAIGKLWGDSSIRFGYEFLSGAMLLSLLVVLFLALKQSRQSSS